MIIKLLLSAIFAVLVVYGLNHKNKSRSVGILINLIALAGCVFVWFPELATEIGHFLGVGRGTDLVLYLFVMATLIVGFSLYLKLNSCMQLITRLARNIALSTPLLPDQDQQQRD
ncbi:MAG: DUF2304 domain-containing protein [Sulfuritalea sp.]|nr:DUF2304 domain-containing protein [Sulfuritalea sp.]